MPQALIIGAGDGLSASLARPHQGLRTMSPFGPSSTLPPTSRTSSATVRP